jgi:hypothetical protein
MDIPPYEGRSTPVDQLCQVYVNCWPSNIE